jgi:hypothetical protein
VFNISKKKNSIFNVNYMAGGRLDSPYMPTKPEPYIKGIHLEIPGEVGNVQQSLILDFDAELLSIAVGASKYEILDNWDIIIEGDKICDTVFAKNVPQGMFLITAKEVLTGVPVTFVFHNDSGSVKSVWVDFQFLRERPFHPIVDFLVNETGNQQVSFTFSAPTGATSLKVQQKTGEEEYVDSTHELLNEESASATVTGLTNGVEYTFRLVIIGGVHEGNSNEVVATPLEV